MTTTRTPPRSSSTSLSSLHSALTTATRTAALEPEALLLSPTSASTRTGATGSTESRGAATRSLARSVMGRSLVSSVYSGREDSEREFVSAEERTGSRLGGSGKVSLDDSWSQVSSVPPVELLLDERSIKREEEEEEEQSLQDDLPPSHSDDRDTFSTCQEGSAPSFLAEYYLPAAVTHSQEDAGLRQSVTRSQSDFSRWLEDTMRLARGDGTSTVDSDDALSSIVSLTRRARVGLAGSPSAFEESSGVHGSDILQDLESLLNEEPLWASEEMPIEPEEKVVVKQEEPEGETSSEEKKVKVEEGVPAAPSPSPSSPSVADRRWKLASFALAASWGTSSSYSFVYTHILRLLDAELNSSHHDNTTTSSSLPAIHIDVFPQPLPLGPSLTLPISGIILVSLLFTLHRLTRPSPPPSALRRARSASPLLDLTPSSISLARELLPLAIEAYTSSHFSHSITLFTRITTLSCAPTDRALASEYLGRAQYRLARLDRSPSTSTTLLEQSIKSFERAVRLSPTTSTTSRASLGRSLFRLSRHVEAARWLSSSLKRSPTLSFAHEYLGKTLLALNDFPRAELHLRQAIALDPRGSSSALAILGEQLHVRGSTTEAGRLLSQALEGRWDLPAVHARLAFVATERMDRQKAREHLAAVVATRETGETDDDMLETTKEACRGSTPFVSWYFVAEPTERRRILEQAEGMYPNEPLLKVLLAVVRRSESTTSSSSEEKELELLQLATTLKKRSTRFPDDLEAKGLYALALMGLEKRIEAQGVYDAFWRELSEKKKEEGEGVGKERGMAFLVMAFYELKAEVGGERVVKARRRKR